MPNLTLNLMLINKSYRLVFLHFSYALSYNKQFFVNKFFQKAFSSGTFPKSILLLHIITHLLHIIRSPWLMEFLKLGYPFNVQCLIAPLRSYMNWHSKQPECSFQTQVADWLFLGCILMWLLTHSNNKINHSQRTFIWGL